MEKRTKYVVLGIETSCDDTAVAIYSTEGGVLANNNFSQISLFHEFGGVVPEIASRSHLEKINSVVKTALSQANITLDDIDVVAVTNKPGLVGSLLVGLCFAKSLAWAAGKKIIGVNHLEGHAFSPLIEHNVPFPHLTLTASGGHTALYIMHGLGQYEMIGHTHDDAAGETFDKIGVVLNIPYPGGPVIEQLAKQVHFEDFFHYPRNKFKGLDFSFSGLKTAVLYDLVKRQAYDMQAKKLLDSSMALKQQVASSLLVCVTDIFKDRLEQALHKYPTIKAITFAGGVACNAYINKQLNAFCAQRGIAYFHPSKQYCTDNGAMIAFVGHYKAQQEQWADDSLDIGT